jgi:glycosyltransferase involved in cell wall biosynthesis
MLPDKLHVSPDVLIATNQCFPPQYTGGSSSSIHELSLAFLDRGLKVAVLSRWSRWARGSYRGWLLIPPRTLCRGGHFWVRDDVCGYPVFRAQDPAATIANLVPLLRPRVTIVQVDRPLTLARPLTDLGVPTIVYFRDAELSDLGGDPRNLDGVTYVTTSKYLANLYERQFGISPLRVPPLVRPEHYQVNSKRKNVTFVGPVAKKGLEIAMALAERRSDIPFVFVESWSLGIRDWMRLRARTSRLNNVTLRRRTDDMRSVYGDAKIVLAPSLLHEGWGRVASEAQISGIPVLASTRGGLGEAVGPGGLLVDPEAGIDEWVYALSELWDNQAIYDRLSTLALLHARRPEFRPDALMSRLIQILSKASDLRFPSPNALCEEG